MKREDIEAYIDKKQKVSDRNYQYYQETGDSRYLRNHERAEDEIQIANQAISAADDHVKVLEYRAELIELAARSEAALREGTIDAVKKVLESAMSMGRVAGWKSRWE